MIIEYASASERKNARSGVPKAVMSDQVCTSPSSFSNLNCLDFSHKVLLGNVRPELTSL